MKGYRMKKFRLSSNYNIAGNYKKSSFFIKFFKFYNSYNSSLDLINFNTFYFDGITFKILQRKNKDKNKPDNYLGAFVEKQFFYISSLYPVLTNNANEQVYKFDYGGFFYVMRIDLSKKKVYIKQAGVKSQCLKMF